MKTQVQITNCRRLLPPFVLYFLAGASSCKDGVALDIHNHYCSLDLAYLYYSCVFLARDVSMAGHHHPQLPPEPLAGHEKHADFDLPPTR